MISVTLKFLRSRWHSFANAHPLVKGMISYAVVWPTSSLIQQTIEGKNLETVDWACVARFGVFGCFYVAPTLYGWVRLSAVMWPKNNLRVALIKAAVEQVSYGPFALTSFYVGMNLLEFKTLSEAIDETKAKFLPTWKIGICVWPVLQTINFSVIPERNRVVFVSLCSLVWTVFMAFMKESTKYEAIEEKAS